MDTLGLIDIWIEKTLFIFLHRDAAGGASLGAGVATHTVLFVGYVDHMVYVR